MRLRKVRLAILHDIIFWSNVRMRYEWEHHSTIRWSRL